MAEVRTIISSITNSASSIYEPSSILEQCTDSYLEQLTHLINVSISLGIPIQIFKGEDEDEQLVQINRPIFILHF